jgi:hypothetical protein
MRGYRGLFENPAQDRRYQQQEDRAPKRTADDIAHQNRVGHRNGARHHLQYADTGAEHGADRKVPDKQLPPIFHAMFLEAIHWPNQASDRPSGRTAPPVATTAVRIDASNAEER